MTFDDLRTDFGHVVGQCSHCQQPFTRDPRNDYMLTDEVWRLLHPEGRKGFLHDDCLAIRAQNLGLELTADSFTRCLCFVNRHIHLPRPEDQMLELARYFSTDTPQAQARKRPHFGYVVAQAMVKAADADRWAASFDGRPCVFQPLFRSSPAELGTEAL